LGTINCCSNRFASPIRNLPNISKDVGKAIQEFKTSFESKNNDKNNKES